MSDATQTKTGTEQPARHEIYYPGYAPAKLGMALFGVVLFLLSLEKMGPLMKLAFTGGRARAEAVRIVKVDAARQETVYTSDADVLTAMKVMEDARDHDTEFWVEYRFTTEDGKAVETRSTLGQHVKPLQPLRDRDGLPSTIRVWYDRSNPQKIALPLQYGTWFLPGVLALFGVIGTFMGMLLWVHAKRPIEMPDLSRSHAEADAPTSKNGNVGS
jgi:hypothetical protein